MASDNMSIKDSTLMPKKLLLNANIAKSEMQKLLADSQESGDLSPPKKAHLPEAYGKQLPESILSP